MAVKGIKVPMGEHKATHLFADTTGYEITCSCGMVIRVRYPAYVNKVHAEREAARHQAEHVRHMSLVHDVQTHGNNNCGRLCIYPRQKEDNDGG